MLSMLPHAFAEHGKAREAWEAWGNHGLPMNSMLFPMLPIPPLQKVLGQFLGIVGMALAEYDLPTKPTNIGRFHLGFLGICWYEVISAKDCWQYWWTLASKIGRLGNLPNQSLLSIDFSTLLPRNVGEIGNI